MSLRLAVVICSYERPRQLAQTVGAVRSQLVEGDQLLVVDQSAKAFAQPGVRVITQPAGLPAARNAGVAATTAPLVLFLDDDVLLHPGCLDAHRRAYDDPRVGGVVGRILEHRVRPNSRRVTNRLDAAGRVRTRLDGRRRQRIATLKGANMSYRRQALEQVGGFDEGYAGTAFLEDADLSTRVAAAGWELWFEPAACLEHLSAPCGGVRHPDPERWRFHNTARFVRRHRGYRGATGMFGVFGAIALRRGLAARDPGRAWALLRALARGWQSVRKS